MNEAVINEAAVNEDRPSAQQIAIEAAAFRHLLQHLDQRKDVQNIDLMNLAGFCRNCLAKWYVAAATEQGETLSYEAAREIVYGMPYEQWKSRYQRAATPEQQRQFASTLGGGEAGAGEPGVHKTGVDKTGVGTADNI
jgi:hypothetical protein